MMVCLNAVVGRHSVEIFDWQQWVDNNQEIPEGAKKICLLPDQTIEGLKICGVYIPLCI